MTECLQSPDGVYPNEPTRPQTVTDAYIVALIAWGNRVLGIATTDRIRWRGERRCIHELEKAGQIR